MFIARRGSRKYHSAREVVQLLNLRIEQGANWKGRIKSEASKKNGRKFRDILPEDCLMSWALCYFNMDPDDSRWEANGSENVKPVNDKQTDKRRQLNVGYFVFCQMFQFSLW